MAAIARTARAQIVHIVRNRMHVAGFRATTQAGLDRNPVWCRGMSPGYPRAFATDSDIEEERRVDSQVREELGEPEGGPAPGVKDKAKQAVSKVGEKVKDAGEAIKGSTDSKTADQVGDAVKGAGGSIENKGDKQQRLGKEDVVTS